MPAILNSTTVFCNTTISCTTEISSLRQNLDEAQRLSYVLGALLALVSLILLCGPLIFNRTTETQPKSNDDEARDMPHSDRFAIAEDPESSQVSSSDSASKSSTHLENPKDYRGVMIEGEEYHICRSDTSILLETGIFSGLANQRELAAECVRGDGTLGFSADKSPIIGNVSVDLTDLKSLSGDQDQQISARKLC